MKTPKTSPFIFMFLFVFFASSAHAQWGWSKKVKGNGSVTTESRSVDDFNKVSVSTGLDVVYSQGPFNVEVEADSNLHEYIITEVKGNTLIVRRKNKISFKNYKTTTIYVSSPDIYALSASSGADLETKGQISTSSMKISVSSGADLMANVTSKSLDISSSSGSDANIIAKSESLEASSSSGSSITIEGSSNDADLSASSGSDIDAKDLTVIDCDASASSAGDITITVTGDLDAKASSGADINYYGSPENVERSVSSGGSVSNN